jgi:hypothetical protein
MVKDDSFTRLLERQPTDKDRQVLYRARDELKLKPTDSFWQLLMALDYYRAMYEEIPARIAGAAKEVTKAVRATAEAQAKAAQEETKTALMQAVHETAVVSAKHGARAATLKWASWLAGGIVVGLLVTFIVAFNLGAGKGSATAADATQKQCGYVAAAEAWGNSSEGQIAHRLAEAGSLRALANCEAPGWERAKDGTCLVRPYKGKTFGWHLPAGN